MAGNLSRAFTKRINKFLPDDGNNEEPKSFSRVSQRSRKPSLPSSPGGIQISAPLELVSATNPLVYDAPDVRQVKLATISTDSCSTHSHPDSIGTPALSSSASVSSRDFTRHGTPVDNLPSHPLPLFDDSPKPFTDSFSYSNVSSDSEAPMVPRRALSHTKRTHQALARQRSNSRLSSERNSAQSASATKARASIDMFSAKPDSTHPFGAELAKVSEMVEDFSASSVKIYGEEEQYLIDHGLRRFDAQDYLLEIGSLYKPAFTLKHQEGGWL